MSSLQLFNQLESENAGHYIYNVFYFKDKLFFSSNIACLNHSQVYNEDDKD